MISESAAYVPVVKPSSPKERSPMFLAHSQVSSSPLAFKTSSSIKGGKSSAMQEPENAPISEINSAKCGISSAIAPIELLIGIWLNY